MSVLVNFFCTVTAALCAVLLLNAFRRVRKRLLLWSGLCFLGLTASNALLFVNLVATTDTNLFVARLSIAAASMTLLVYGLVFESD